MKSFAEIPFSPLCSLISLRAVRKKFMFETPGISTGYWKAKNNPSRALSSTERGNKSTPLKFTSP